MPICTGGVHIDDRTVLKRIAVSEVRLGMHLHRLEGPWLAHPFWRTRFTLEDAVDRLAADGSCDGRGGDIS